MGIGKWNGHPVYMKTPPDLLPGGVISIRKEPCLSHEYWEEFEEGFSNLESEDLSGGIAVGILHSQFNQITILSIGHSSESRRAVSVVGE